MLKKNFFPIAGKRGRKTASIAKLNETEMPYLILPIWDTEIDPEALIKFYGIYAIPAPGLGKAQIVQARVIIEFFHLNGRSELRRDRAEQLIALHYALKELNRDPQSLDAKKDIERLIRDDSPHAACKRSFVDLYRRDPEKARNLLRAARNYLYATEPISDD